MRRIIVLHFPPISARHYHYCAHFDGDEDEPLRHGWGSTAEAARDDLLRREKEGSLETEEQRLLEEYP